MPELPEVETIKLQLESKIKGLKITDIEVLNKKSFIGNVGEIRGIRVIGVKRRGKITIIELEGGIFLAIHLKLTGQLIYREKQETRISKACCSAIKKQAEYCEQKDGPFAVCELPNKYTRVIISFDPPSSRSVGLRRASKLYFNDLRMFGWMKIIQSSKFKVQNYNSKFKIEDGLPELKKLGPEANDENSFTLDYFRGILKKTGKPIKIVMMDQEKIAGIGNIYANEALFTAGILPTRKAKSLTETEIEKVRKAIIEVLNEAIKHKGSSDRDEAYRQITGEKGTHQNYLQVYGRAGENCPKCRGIIKRIALGGRGTFYCEKCQH